MSLFKAREWWSTWCGGAEEEFDLGSLCISNIDNHNNGLDKIVVCSFNGILRIYIPQKEGFKPADLMLEMQMNQPILQIVSGKFVSGTEQLHLGVLHPRSLCVYSVTGVSGSVEHANHFTLTKMYEHRLERTAAGMTYGPFGGVNEKDFICVLSMDGVLAFFEQETFSLQAYLPNFLIPGPIVYMASTDSFIASTAERNLECYRYHSLASSYIGNSKKSKKIPPEWSKSLGEHALDIQVINSMIVILGERSFFKMSAAGVIVSMKKLEYNPSCILPYTQGAQDDSMLVMVGTHSNSVQIYKEIELIWAAQLPHVPVSCKISKFQDLEGVLVTLDEFGHLYASYLGTDPSLFVAPQVESRMGNFEEMEKELKCYNSIIRKCENGSGKLTAGDQKENLVLKVTVPDKLDEISQWQGENDDEDYDIPSITVKIDLECKSIKPIENINLVCCAKHPILCSQPQIDVPVIGVKGPVLTFEVSFYTVGVLIPADLVVMVTATYANDSEAPRIIQTSFELPLNLVARGTPPVKQANYKLTIDTNREPANLAEIFPEMVNDVVIPVPVLGVQYIGGPVVTILSSKQSNRYRIQSDLFEAMYLLIKELVTRLQSHFKGMEGVPFKASFKGQIPLNEYFELVDAHFERRVSLNTYNELLNKRASQFRVIQKRLLTRFKDKTPSPLNHLDTILDGTYQQILALADECANTELALKYASNVLSSGTRLLNYLIKLSVDFSDYEGKILNACLTPVVSESLLQGWEEIVFNNVAFLLKTCLAKSTKDRNSQLSITTTMEKDTTKLKRNISLMVDRLNNGARLNVNKSRAGKVNFEDDETRDFDNAVLRKRMVNNIERHSGESSD